MPGYYCGYYCSMHNKLSKTLGSLWGKIISSPCPVLLYHVEILAASEVNNPCSGTISASNL